MKNKNLILFFLIFIIGIILRIYNLGKFSLWFDESLQFVSAAADLKKLLFYDKSYCITLYNIFIHSYERIIGDNEFLLRLPSAVFGIISVVMLYRLGKSLFNNKAGLFSAFILAISPFHIYYSQEARMYSLITLLSLISIYCLVKIMHDNRITYWLGYILSSLINIYSHPMGIFIFAAEIMFFLIYIKKYNFLIKRWIIAHLFMLIFYIPWVKSMLYGGQLVINKYNWFFELSFSWIPKITWVNLFYTFKNFSIGYNATRQVYLFATLLFCVLFLYGIFRFNVNKEGKILSLLCLFVPILSVYLISKFRPCYLDRYFVPSLLLFYLIIGEGLSRMGKKYTVAATVCIIIFSFAGLKNYYKNYLPDKFEEHIGVQTRKDYRSAVRYLAENLKEGDVIFHTCRSSIPSFEYYFGKIYKGSLSIEKNLILQFSKDSNSSLMPFEYNTTSLKFSNQPKNIDLQKKNNIWVIFSGWDFKLASKPHSSESKIIQWMDKHYIRKDNNYFSGIIIYLYEKKRGRKLYVKAFYKDRIIQARLYS